MSLMALGFLGADDWDFATWAAEVSQRTNRSLAGRRVVMPDDGSRPLNGSDCMLHSGVWCPPRRRDVHGRPVKAGEAPLDPSAPVGGLFDSRHADGVEAMDAAQAHMPVTAALLDELTRETDLHGVRIAVCLILEPKTAVLLRLMKAAGATVGVFCEPESTDQRVADQLRRDGITVQADAGWTAEQAHQGALRLLD